ncbi:MAG: aspartate aminotransferase family protein [Proteobacteria bacterium]|nr:aspartate aminotransferase family protein [Pseudomonadota bacterium]
MDAATESATGAAGPLHTDWSTEGIVRRRDRYYAATQRAFVPYKTPLIFQRGQGQYLWDEKGNKYVDLLGMNVCVSVGHAHPKVTAAVKAQVDDLQHCTTMFYHPTPAHFAEELAAKMPAGADWVVHFTNSGAEAIDLALVMAQAFTGHIDMLALRNAYHGATMGAQSLTGISGFRHNVPLLGGIHHVANPDPYRGAFGADVDAYLAEIDRTIQHSTSGRLAGLLVEPVQGYGGIIELPPGYLKAATEKVRARGGVLIADEVQSGFGRTGDSFWAFEAHDVIPEIVVMAKGIGNGFPLGAVVAQRHVAEVLADKFYFNTYGANPVACAAGRAVLQVLDEEGLQANAKTVGAALGQALQRLHQKYEIIGEVRGRGLMQAIELVRDRRTREPATAETATIFELTRDLGIVVSKSGPNRNILRMVPPLCLSLDDIPQVETALDACFSRAAAAA